MFSIKLFEPNLILLYTIINSLIVGFIFIKMAYSYTNKRAGRNYSQGRTPAPSISSFRFLSKLFFVISMLVTLLSHWVISKIFLTVYDITFVQVFGTTLVIIGFINLNKSFTSLGNNYSPLFDAYVPKNLIITESYRKIRHPIYLYNLFISFGLAISSGSAVVMTCAFIGFFFIIKTISLEESYLNKEFSHYHNYSTNTWRLVPHLY